MQGVVGKEQLKKLDLVIKNNKNVKILNKFFQRFFHKKQSKQKRVFMIPSYFLKKINFKRENYKYS